MNFFHCWSNVITPRLLRCIVNKESVEPFVYLREGCGITYVQINNTPHRIEYIKWYMPIHGDERCVTPAHWKLPHFLSRINETLSLKLICYPLDSNANLENVSQNTTLKRGIAWQNSPKSFWKSILTLNYVISIWGYLFWHAYSHVGYGKWGIFATCYFCIGNRASRYACRLDFGI